MIFQWGQKYLAKIFEYCEGGYQEKKICWLLQKRKKKPLTIVVMWMLMVVLLFPAEGGNVRTQTSAVVSHNFQQTPGTRQDHKESLWISIKRVIHQMHVTT